MKDADNMYQAKKADEELLYAITTLGQEEIKYHIIFKMSQN